MENEPIYIQIEQPTIKDQFIQAGVGLGIAAALTVGTVLILAAGGAVIGKIQERKTKKNLASAEPTES